MLQTSLNTLEVSSYIQKMKKERVDLQPIRHSAEKRSNSSGNLLARRLYRNSSLTKLAPLNNTTSILGSLNTSLIPSISLRKLNKLEHSQPSIEISQGKIHVRRYDQLPFMTQQASLMKKKGAHRKFQKVDSITQKSILPEELKADISSMDLSSDNPQKFKPNRKWLAKLKQGRQSIEERLTPEDFIQLIEEEGGLGNQFCYLQQGAHPYDLQIVEFKNTTGGQYITISARGVTYFNWEGSRFVTLEEWRRQADLFTKLMNLQFFGKYKLHKNFSKWKKNSRKTVMRKTRQKLQAELLVEDRFLRQALLQTRSLCCRLQTETNYCSFDDTAPALPFHKFKLAQQNFLNQKFQKRINELQQQIKCDVATCLGISMRQFKEVNKISSSKDGKGIPLLNGDEKNLDMPYTKEATLRVQQEKFKRFLKLVDILVVHSKINMMDYATLSTARKLEQQNENYQQYLKAKTEKKKKEDHFKGKQYIECQLQIEENQQKSVLRPSREELTTLMEDIVNRSTIKLIKNHHRIITDPDIIAILYEGAEEQNKDPDPTNILKTILGAEEKQQSMVEIVNKSLNLSYNYLEDYKVTLQPLVVQFFKNQSQLFKIPELTSQDFFTIKEWIQTWRKQLHEVSKLNDQYESSVFLLNFKNVKELTIQCANLCITKIKEVVPKILESALQDQEEQLRDSLRLMDVVPIGIQVYITFQNNKNQIASRFDEFDERLGQIGQLIEIMKDLGGSGQHIVIRSHKQRKQLGQMMKSLRTKVEEAEMHNKVHQANAQEEVRSMVPKVFANIESLYTNTKQPRLSTTEMVSQIEKWESEYCTIHQQFLKLQEYQRFLGMQRLNEESIERFAEYFKTYQSIWTYKLNIERYHQQFLIASWKALSTEQVKLDLQKYLEDAENIKKVISKYKSADSYQIQYADENTVSSAVMDIKKKIKPILEAIECLRDPSLEEREQRAIKNEFQIKNKKRLAELIGEPDATVQHLLKEGLVDELDFLKKVVFKSKKQLQLNSKMATVSRFWGESMGHASKGLIDNFALHYYTIAAEIDQKITVINCVREDPEVEEGQFRMRVEVQKNLLDSLRQLLTQWEKHHNYLSYFEPIFTNPYWKGTSQYKAYTYAQSNWKKLIKQLSKDFSLRKLATQEKKHLSILKENNIIFQDLKHSVELFLNAKRQAFPKLYFISNQQLLHLLLQNKDYSSIDKHLSMIFPHLKSLELNQERNCPLAVKNLANQCLTLRTLPPKQVLQLEEGLRAIEERMKEAIKSSLLKCSNYYIQDDFKSKQWVNENVLQVLLFIGNVQFTKLLEYDYLSSEGEDMNQLLSYQMNQIKQLHSSIREDIQNHSVSNFKHQILLMQAGHFRDIILRLMQLHVRDDNSFEWQKEIRSYYNGGEIAYTKYLTKAVDYGYEFVCPTSSYAISTLSQKYFIELANTAGFQYLPVLVEKGQIISHFCMANAKSHFSVALQPKLSISFIHNICQGALSSNTYLEINQAQHINEEIASLICSFIHESKCILQKKQLFNLSNSGKNSILPTFSIALRMGTSKNFKPLQQHLKVNFRVVSVPQIPIAVYVSCICNLMFFSDEKEFSQQIQKACQIVNKCCGYQAFTLQKIRTIVLGSITPVFSDFKDKIFNSLIKQLENQICQQEEVKFYQNILREVILLEKIEEQTKGKAKPDKDGKNIMNVVIDVLDKKQLCVLVGPTYTGKKDLMLQAYKASGLGPVQLYYTDLITYEEFLGTFENGLWKEGILAKHLKRISYSQEEWFVLEGKFGTVTEQLLKSIIKGSLLLQNGQLLYLSPNWKFLISTDVLQKDIIIPGTCEIIYSQTFISDEQQLQHSLQTIIRPYFKTNIEGYSVLTNLCLNNFQKIMKFRVKGRFLKTDHLQKNFINILESVISKCPEKNLQAKDNQIGLQKLFLWCIYWTIYSSLSVDSAKKFENQLFEQIKLEIDRSLPLAMTKFELDNVNGSLKRIETPTVTLLNVPYYVNSQREAIYKFIELYLTKSKNILLIGDGTCGKSAFLTYIKQNLREENHSFLMIKLSKHMSSQKFEQLLYRKAKIGVSPNKQKYLSAINGKKLIIMLDDINLLDQNSFIGRFLRNILVQGYYYDHITLQKIHLNNVSLIAAQNSSYEFNLSYQIVKYFKPVYLPPLSIRQITQRYQPLIKSEYSTNLCRNIASLHEFTTIGKQYDSSYEYKTISQPIRILQSLRNYKGNENLVKVWQFLSMKEYIDGFPLNQAQNQKIRAEIKNYSNLMLKNNDDQSYPLENYEILLSSLATGFPFIKQDQQYEDYYVYLIIKMQLNKSINLFTINEHLCPSSKLLILECICKQIKLGLIHPYHVHEISATTYSDAKLVVYVSDSDQFFQEMLQFLMSESKENVMFIVDFTSMQQWTFYTEKYPSLLNCGSRFYKRKPVFEFNSYRAQYSNEIQQWCSYFQKENVSVSEYEKQQLKKVVNKHLLKIIKKCQNEFKRIKQLMNNAEMIKKTADKMKNNLDDHREELNKISKEEEMFRKQLLSLKNSYENQQTEQEKIAKNSKIGSIQIKLNELMAMKRSGEDQLRAKQDQFASQENILKTVQVAMQSVRGQFDLFNLISQKRKKFAAFLALLDYFYSKHDQNKAQAIKKISQKLQIKFEQLIKLIFDCDVQVDQRSQILWLLNDKSLIIEDESQQFISSIQSRYNKCQVIRTPKELQDFIRFQPGMSYILVGQMRSEINYVNDLSLSTTEQLSRDKSRNKDQNKDNKQDKFIKEAKQDKPNYKKSIYFIYKDKESLKQLKPSRSSHDTTDPMRASRNFTRDIKDETSPGLRKVDRRTTKMLTNFANPLLSLLNPPKTPDIQGKQKVYPTIHNEMLLKIKYKQIKEGENYCRNDNQMQDFLVFTLSNEQFLLGGKKITSIQDSNGSAIPHITLVCKKGLPPTQRQQLKKYHTFKKDQDANLIEELLESTEQFLTGIIRNQQKEIQKFQANKKSHELVILQKIKENSNKSLNDLGTKNGVFQATLTESIQMFTQKLQKSKRTRNQPYQQYFQFALSIWKYLKKLSSIYTNFRMNKKQFKELTIKCIANNSKKEEEEEERQATEKINSKLSREILLKKTIGNVIISLSYCNSLFALCLLSILLQVREKETAPQLFDLYAEIMKGKIKPEDIQNALKTLTCQKNLKQLLELYAKNSQLYFPTCQLFVSSVLTFDIQKQYYLIKAQWPYLEQSFIVMGLPGANTFSSLGQMKRAFFIKQNSQYFKCSETMQDRGLNKLVLVNFTKEENYHKIISLFEQWPKDNTLYTIFLFTETEFYQKCQFKQAINEKRIVQIQERKIPSKELAAVIERNLGEPSESAFVKILRTVFFNDLHSYFKQKIDAPEMAGRVQNACFYDSDLINSIVSEVVFKDPRQLLEIVSRTIYSTKEKMITRESKRYVKRQEGSQLYKLILSQSGSGEEINFQHQFFMTRESNDILSKITTTAGCEQFARSILSVDQRRLLNKYIFNGWYRQKSQNISSDGSFQIDQNDWNFINSLTFQSFKSLESMKFKKQVDMTKNLIRKENSRNYLLYRWIQHNIKALKQINPKVILSEQTKITLKKLRNQQLIWGLPSSPTKCLQDLQKKIRYLEEVYHNSSHIKKLNLQYWSSFDQTVYLHLYVPSKRIDLSKAQIVCKIMSEKEEKIERGWIIEQIQLKNCKFDVSKQSLELNDRNDNKKIQNILILLQEKDIIQGPCFSLPVFYKGKEIFRIDMMCKFKEEGLINKQKIFGVIKSQQE